MFWNKKPKTNGRKSKKDDVTKTKFMKLCDLLRQSETAEFKLGQN